MTYFHIKGSYYGGKSGAGVYQKIINQKIDDMRDKVISNALKMVQEMSASEAQEALNDLSEADRWFIGNLKLMIDIQILKVKGGKAEAIDKKALVEWILKYL